MRTDAYAAHTPKEELSPYSYDTHTLSPWDIDITISHCGICHSDIHLIDNDWQTSNYPLVPGHEIVGTITARGDSVTQLQVGQRVGVGWQCSSCLDCEWCSIGQENMCSSQKATCVDQHGGFATSIRTDSRFAFALPQGLDSASTAPLFCGGATVYSPLRQHITRPSMRVGIVGIGGLGHLAIKFAHAFGCEVTALSSNPSKVDEARELGATHFISSVNGDALKKAANSLDFILYTAHAELDWTAYLNILRPRGKLCFVGVVPKIETDAFSLIIGRKTICGSNIASRPEIAEMLLLADRLKIKAQIERYAMTDVNAAIAHVRQGHAKYRVVLEN